jgi:hypothetical protein
LGEISREDADIQQPHVELLKLAADSLGIWLNICFFYSLVFAFPFAVAFFLGAGGAEPAAPLYFLIPAAALCFFVYSDPSVCVALAVEGSNRAQDSTFDTCKVYFIPFRPIFTSPI